MKFKSIKDLDLQGKIVVMREDLNVPIKDGKISSDKRIRASLPNIQYALQAGAGVFILSHLGRPEEGQAIAPEDSLQPVATRLSELLGKPVPLVLDYINGLNLQPGQVALGENVRSLVGEKKNKPELAQKLANLGDVYIMDAFATAHRAQASTEGAIRLAKVAGAGLLMSAELEAITKILHAPTKPLLAILGGSKVSTKLEIIENLSKRVDQLILGGGIANTFLKAAGFKIGKSLCEEDLVKTAAKILTDAKSRGLDIPLPVDVVVAKSLTPDAKARTIDIQAVADDDMILDIGPKTVQMFTVIIGKAGTIVWNGPVGAFEIDQFGAGTKAMAIAIANSQAYSVTGGGDSIAALEKYNCINEINYVSTAGGAFLEVLEGKELPAVAALEAKA